MDKNQTETSHFKQKSQMKIKILSTSKYSTNQPLINTIKNKHSNHDFNHFYKKTIKQKHNMHETPSKEVSSTTQIAIIKGIKNKRNTTPKLRVTRDLIDCANNPKKETTQTIPKKRSTTPIQVQSMYLDNSWNSYNNTNTPKNVHSTVKNNTTSHITIDAQQKKQLHIIIAWKKQINALNDIITKKDDEIIVLKKSILYTKINESKIENDILVEEIGKLTSILRSKSKDGKEKQQLSPSTGADEMKEDNEKLRNNLNRWIAVTKEIKTQLSNEQEHTKKWETKLNSLEMELERKTDEIKDIREHAQGISDKNKDIEDQWTLANERLKNSENEISQKDAIISTNDIKIKNLMNEKQEYETMYNKYEPLIRYFINTTNMFITAETLSYIQLMLSILYSFFKLSNEDVLNQFKSLDRDLVGVAKNICRLFKINNTVLMERYLLHWMKDTCGDFNWCELPEKFKANINADRNDEDEANSTNKSTLSLDILRIVYLELKALDSANKGYVDISALSKVIESHCTTLGEDSDKTRKMFIEQSLILNQESIDFTNWSMFDIYYTGFNVAGNSNCPDNTQAQGEDAINEKKTLLLETVSCNSIEILGVSPPCRKGSSGDGNKGIDNNNINEEENEIKSNGENVTNDNNVNVINEFSMQCNHANESKHEDECYEKNEREEDKFNGLIEKGDDDIKQDTNINGEARKSGGFDYGNILELDTLKQHELDVVPLTTGHNDISEDENWKGKDADTINKNNAEINENQEVINENKEGDDDDIKEIENSVELPVHEKQEIKEIVDNTEITPVNKEDAIWVEVGEEEDKKQVDNEISQPFIQEGHIDDIGEIEEDNKQQTEVQDACVGVINKETEEADHKPQNVNRNNQDDLVIEDQKERNVIEEMTENWNEKRIENTIEIEDIQNAPQDEKESKPKEIQNEERNNNALNNDNAIKEFNCSSGVSKEENGQIVDNPNDNDNKYQNMDENEFDVNNSIADNESYYKNEAKEFVSNLFELVLNNKEYSDECGNQDGSNRNEKENENNETVKNKEIQRLVIMDNNIDGGNKGNARENEMKKEEETKERERDLIEQEGEVEVEGLKWENDSKAENECKCDPEVNAENNGKDGTEAKDVIKWNEDTEQKDVKEWQDDNEGKEDNNKNKDKDKDNNTEPKETKIVEESNNYQITPNKELSIAELPNDNQNIISTEDKKEEDPNNVDPSINHNKSIDKLPNQEEFITFYNPDTIKPTNNRENNGGDFLL